MLDYASFFAAATTPVGEEARVAYPYQRRLAEAATWPDVLEVPTGAGKTEATVLGWMWRRYVGREEPLRLVYTLPMRGLVEQTHKRVAGFVERLSHAYGANFDAPGVEKLLGGEIGEEWIEAPERPMILIGTQDLLLSRALNRGYAMSRFAWPMTFGWLNDDTLWIVDEVQLQGVGVTTSAQLQGLRERLGTHRPTATIFVSATIDRSWLACADYRIGERLQRDGAVVDLTAEDREEPRLRRILEATKTARRLDVYAPVDVARAVLKRHRAGTRTLVILNQVARAREVETALTRLAPRQTVRLLHSRFRPRDRSDAVEACFGESAPTDAMIIATQVVEAGIDTSAITLVSDLAPWASIVQRLGRCNRRGDDVDAAFFWLDPGSEPPKTSILPYARTDLLDARQRLLDLEGRSVAPCDLPSGVSIPRERGATLRRVDLLDLFDTTPDLSGNDVDVSRFIRLDDEFNVYALWRSDQTDDRAAHRSELCPVPRGEMQKLLKRLSDHGRSSEARVEVQLRRRRQPVWATASAQTLRIGETVRLEARVGAYDALRGFDLAVSAPVDTIPVEPRFEPSAQSVEDDTLSAVGRAVTLIQHSDDAARIAGELVASLPELGRRFTAAVVTAARWHDAGKVHDVFQQTMTNAGASSDGGPWAKSPRGGGRHVRAHFRHELVSALAWLAESEGEQDTDLVAYLVAAHHGKARVTLQTFPGEPLEPRSILGVHEGDIVGSASLGDTIVARAFTVELAAFDIGGTIRADGSIEPSWSDRMFGLRDDAELGPFRLAYLEALVRVADWRASKLRADPAFVGTVGAIDGGDVSEGDDAEGDRVNDSDAADAVA